MGCMPSSTSQIHAFSNVFAFSQRFGQHSCDEAAREILPVEGCFYINARPELQAWEFILFRCDLGAGTATSHNSGGPHIVFFLESREHHSNCLSKNGTFCGCVIQRQCRGPQPYPVPLFLLPISVSYWTYKPQRALSHNTGSTKQLQQWLPWK